jgi:hypothetical protein
MAFWILILFASGGAVLAYKKSGFYKMWAIVFNIFIAIYMGIMLSPWIVSLIPSGTNGLQYQKAACVVCVAILVFGLLQAITVNFITCDYEIGFPKLFNSIGTAVLGFIGGLTVTSFVLLLISLLPFAEAPFVKNVTGKETAERLAAKPVVTLCNFITSISIQPPEGKPRQVISKLINPATLENPETETVDNATDLEGLE